MGSDSGSVDDVLSTVLPEVIRNQRMLVLAPNGTVNTGVVKGDQRNVLTAPAPDGERAVALMRQGPVRAKDLHLARRRFARPPVFEAGLAALDSGVLVLVGQPSTGRLTSALNLLAHGYDDPTLFQVDGAVDFAHWRPRPNGVHGYLVMEPGDPFALRPWDLADLEGRLAEAGARLVIVLPDAPGLARTLTDKLGVPVVRHEPPDPREVFAAHLADLCPDAPDRTRQLLSLEPGFLPEVLPPELPPRYAAQVAQTVARLGAGGAVSGSEVMACLAAAEAPDLLARSEGDPELLAHLLSVCVYGGLDRETVVDRAAELLALAGPPSKPSPAAGLRNPAGMQGSGLARQRPLRDVLRCVGARCAVRGDDGGTQAVEFWWPAVGAAVWDVVCREHPGLLPLLHEWLGGSGQHEPEIERAGRAVAGMAVRTGGRTFGLVRELALSAGPSGVEVAAWCLGTAVRDDALAGKAHELLQEWSEASETALRTAVAYACRPDRGGVGADHAMALLHRVVGGRGDDSDDDVAVALTGAETVVRLFAAGDSDVRETVACHLAAWAQAEDVAGLLAAVTFPALVDSDHVWFGGRLLDGRETAERVVALVSHALNESAAYASMRDTLLAWCGEADELPEARRQVAELFARLVDSRQPGFLRLLLSVERGGAATPGKDLAEQSLAEWRRRNHLRQPA